MLRRLHKDQPDRFAFTEANEAWARAQITKYPEGRQASAVIPLLWRAQEQEGWLSRPAIEHVAQMLDMAYIRALEVATFYFMFQLQPVGSLAHVQVCGTTSCMICGAEDLVAVCRERIAPRPHALSADGRFSWEEVECLGACANAPMVQIGKDYYEDLTAESFAALLDRFAAGEVPVPGPQNGRYAAEPAGGLTSLTQYAEGRPEHNASAALAVELQDTIRRIDGTEVPLVTHWNRNETTEAELADSHAGTDEPRPAEGVPVDKTGIDTREAPVEEPGHPEADARGNDFNADDPGPAARARGGVRPTSPLAGQGELASRKGSWRYSPPTKGRDMTASDADAPASAASGPPPGKPATPAQPDTAPASGAGGGAASAGEARPQGLDAPRGGQPDDLKKIRGVGPKLERLLHSLGFYHYEQIARWTDAELRWVDAHLEGFRGRATRDDWVSQARVLAEGGETDFSKRAK